MHRGQGFFCETAFLERAKLMLESVDNDGEFDIEDARNTLARAPLHKDILETYGRLMGEIMARATEESVASNWDIDALVLEEYFQFVLAQEAYPYIPSWYPETTDDVLSHAFQCMNNYPEDDADRQGLVFVSRFLRASIQLEIRAAQQWFSSCFMPHGLNDVISRFECSGGHPALRKMVAQNSALIDRLLEYFDYQMREQMPKPTLSAPLGKFYRALVPIIAEGLWTPTTAVQCEQLWLAHEQLTILRAQSYVEAVPWASGFATRLVHNKNFFLHRSLHHLLQKDQLSIQHMAEFFPLPLAHCSPKDVLPLLIQLERRSQGLVEDMHFGEAFLLQMQEHHPRVASLLTMHRMVFPDAESAHENAQLLLAAFEDACGHTPAQVCPKAIDNIDGDVFKYEDVYSPIGLPTC